ncbi:hypothetical protein A9D12_06530 [Erythrobacter neustonensis]|uniref:Uncharacterized protein n=1 Tax=Erythrobacter neustonensis TaxID=1112 RepID=A0A192D4F7_9SPHN|nr:hypothetical protein A9D12_06530 [Erythrobacter neustonensis]
MGHNRNGWRSVGLFDHRNVKPLLTIAGSRSAGQAFAALHMHMQAVQSNANFAVPRAARDGERMATAPRPAPTRR